MIYRKWSLLTGPTAIIGGIVGATIVANYLFIQNVILFPLLLSFDFQQSLAFPLIPRSFLIGDDLYL
ncbi:hypothetical protein LINPERHAP1_LOCUS20117 [Linum perenne]